MATIKSRRAVNKTLRASKKLYKAFAARMEDKFERISELESDLVVTNIQDRHDSHHLAEDVVEKITALGPCSGKFEIIRVTRLGPTIAQTLEMAKSLGLKITEDDAEYAADYILDMEMEVDIWWKAKPVIVEDTPALDDSSDLWGDDDETYIVRFVRD